MKGKRAKSTGNKGTKAFVIVLVLLIIIAAALFALKVVGENNTQMANGESASPEVNEQEPEVPTPKTLAGDSRPVAVMIDNHIDAMPQAGLLEADIVYEIIVEGGETRLMLILQDEDDLEKVGPVRSSRHYFLDYALENDAIYVHYGWSPQAQSDISTLGVDNINGIYESSSSFWRVQDKYAPHNAVTSMENIMDIADRKGYRVDREKENVLNYVVDEVNLADGKAANTVTIPYSYANTVKYKYDADKKEYVRYSRGEKQKDWDSGKTVTTKNIIITKARNSTLNDGSGKGRQTLDNVDTLDGYYITNGKAIKITCEKKSRSGQTVYKDLEGNEIDVNDGKTFIQICPIDADVEFEGEE